VQNLAGLAFNDLSPLITALVGGVQLSLDSQGEHISINSFHNTSPSLRKKTYNKTHCR